MLSIGFVVALVFLLAFAAGAVALMKIRSHMDKRYDSEDRNWMLVFTGACVAFIVMIMGCLFPWGLSFHVLEQHTGTVSRVEQRYVTSGSDSNVNITKEIVFWLNGENKAYVTDDIRFQALKPGDAVNLRRQEQFNYGGTNTWGTTYISVSPALKAATNPTPVTK